MLPLRLPKFLTLLVCLSLLIFAPQLVRAAGAPVELGKPAGPIQAWPAVAVLADASRTLTPEQALSQRERFTTPTGAYATLGLRKEPVWLRIPVAVSPQGGGRWVLDIDYPALNRVEVFVARNGQLQRQALLGNLQPFSQRPIGSRTHAVGMDFTAGERAEVLLRVEAVGGMVLPITFSRPATFHVTAMREQMLQGVLSGLGLCLLLYSLAQWLSLREPLFAKYALLVFGSLLFSVFVFGVGAQYLWTDNIWMELHAGGIAALIASCGSFLFVEQALAGPDSPRWFRRLMKGGAVLTLVFAAVHALDLIDTHVVTAIVGSLGLAPALLGLPGAIRRQRRGDWVGGYFLVAWAAYFVFTAITVAVIKGQVGVNAFTMHAFQIGATIDMLIFMRVLGLRTVAIKAAAQQAARDRDLLHALAHTDALTGLANRRGLSAALNDALAECSPQRMVGVFLLDLNGFKQVNDRFGHEVGDELLIAVSRRLQGKLHARDLVARLGGDEFIVMCCGLQRESQAEELAKRMLQALDTPFNVRGQMLSIGMAVGHALAPRDGRDATVLLRQADAAMYRGKPLPGGGTLSPGRVDPSSARASAPAPSPRQSAAESAAAPPSRGSGSA